MKYGGIELPDILEGETSEQYAARNAAFLSENKLVILRAVVDWSGGETFVTYRGSALHQEVELVKSAGGEFPRLMVIG